MGLSLNSRLGKGIQPDIIAVGTSAHAMFVVVRCEVIVVGGFVGGDTAFEMAVERTESGNADADHRNGELGVGPDCRLGGVIWIALVRRLGIDRCDVQR